VHTAHGAYAATIASPSGDIVGTPLSGTGYGWTVQTTVTPTAITTVIN